MAHVSGLQYRKLRCDRIDAGCTHHKRQDKIALQRNELWIIE
jgi:hypothetical protein